MQVIPAVLVQTPEEFENQLLKLLPYFDYFQIDIQDRILVESKTVDIDQIVEVFKKVPQLTEKKIVIDVDLQVKDPRRTTEKFEFLPSNIRVNYVFLREKNASKEDLEELRGSQFFPTIALEPDDSVETIDKKFELVTLPSVQIMTIHSGPQGSPFIPEQLNKIEQLRNAGYRNKVFLDGSVNNQTLPLILEREFKPDAVCIGSYFSKTDNIEERLNTIQEILAAEEAGHQ